MKSTKIKSEPEIRLKISHCHMEDSCNITWKLPTLSFYRGERGPGRISDSPEIPQPVKLRWASSFFSLCLLMGITGDIT